MNLHKKILVPYFWAGRWHIIAAESIVYYLIKEKPEWDIRFIEPVDEFKDKRMDKFFRKSWQLLLKKPFLAKFVYSVFANTFPSTTLAATLIITTHFGCGHIFNAARKELGCDIPLFYARNDLGRAFHIQDCDADILFVTSQDAKNDFIRIGVQQEKMKNVNFLGRDPIYRSLF